MKLRLLKDNLKISILSITCVSGLVSCYPVTPLHPVVTPKEIDRPSGVKSPEELAKAKAKKTAEANKYKTSIKRNKERLEREEKARIAAERKEAAEYKKNITSSDSEPFSSSTSSDSGSSTSNTTTTTPKTTTPKPPAPTVKYAAPVPGKPGFCYNPWTHNQVDVRGIPSGTRVRDPHDSDRSHVFKVP